MSLGHDYALYMDVPNTRVKLYAWLGVISLLLSSLLHDAGTWIAAWMLGHGQDLGWLTSFLTSIGAMAIFGLLVYLFCKFVWKWPIATPLYHLVSSRKPPLLAGKYCGTLTVSTSKPNVATAQTSSSDAPTSPMSISEVTTSTLDASNFHVTIMQSWDNILVRFDFFDQEGWRYAGSNSQTALLDMNLDPNRTTLQYTYEFSTLDTNSEGQTITRCIHGTAMLTFDRSEEDVKSKNGWRVHGRFYSDDGSSGTVKLEQVKNFPPINRAGCKCGSR